MSEEESGSGNGLPHFILLLAFVSGIATGAYVFSTHTTDTKVVNQTVAIYDIEDIQLEGMCYDEFRDLTGEAKNLDSMVKFSEEKERLKGDIGEIVINNSIEEIDAEKAECPPNSTEAELHIEEVEYSYKVYQAGKLISKGREKAYLFVEIELERYRGYGWEAGGEYEAIDDIYDKLKEQQPW